MCSIMNRKLTPITFKIELAHSFGPLASLLASDAYFQLKFPYFVYLALSGTENLNNSNQNYPGGSF